jgi:transcriptional regulator with XRE-family HTH domain
MTISGSYRNLIQSLKVKRQKLQLKQYNVSRKLGMCSTWLGKIERCELRLDIMYLIKLCRIYYMSSAQLVHRLEKELP